MKMNKSLTELIKDLAKFKLIPTALIIAIFYGLVVIACFVLMMLAAIFIPIIMGAGAVCDYFMLKEGGDSGE